MRVSTSRFTRLSLTIAAIAIATASAAQPALANDKDTGTCTLSTLKGVYIFNASGFAPNLVPKAVVEMLRMPGDGTITVLATANVGGNVIANNIAATGSYTVNEDCSGTLAFSGGQHFNIYIAPSGKEFHMNQVDAGHVLAGKVTRVGSYGEQ